MSFQVFKHEIKAQLRFSDFDMLGHMNNSVYLQLMDLAKVDYFAKTTGKTPSANGVCPVVAHIEIDFDEPTFSTEAPAIVTRTVAIGTKSLTLEQQVIVPASGRVKCRAKVVMVNLDLTTGNTVEIDPIDRAKISQYEEREL